MQTTIATRTTAIDERRTSRRTQVCIPVTLLDGERSIPAYTRDLSPQGVFVSVPSGDDTFLDQELHFIIEFPPEITLCTSLKARCTARIVRKLETGVAAQIYRYTFLAAD